jgi:hypothetical protein
MGQIYQRVKLMQSVYLQRIMKKNAAKYEKTTPKQTQFKSCPERQFPKGQNELKIVYQKSGHISTNQKKFMDNPEKNDYNVCFG